MKTTVNAQELARLLDQSERIFTSCGGVNIETNRAMVIDALTHPIMSCVVGHVKGVLFIYSLE